jgi:HK97 family phage major capsid protein
MSTAVRPAADIDREVKEKSQELAQKSEQLHNLYGLRDGDGNRVLSPDTAEQIDRLERELNALEPMVNSLKWDWREAHNRERRDAHHNDTSMRPGLFAGGNGNGVAGGNGSEPSGTVTIGNGAMKTTVALPESLGDAFIESPAFKAWIHQGPQGQSAHVEVPTLGIKHWVMREAMKATLTTSTGPFTLIEKQPSVVMLGQQELTVADLMSQAQTNSTTIRYIQEDSFTNIAAMVAEEGQKPEATWDLSEVDSNVKKIGAISRMSDEMFNDYAQVRDYVNQRLPFMVKQREEFQLLTGDGLGNNILGVLNVPGILTQAKGANNNIDTLYLAITAIRNQGFFEPDAVVIHPNNWAAIRLLKTTQGEYEYGHPAVAGPETIFGKRVVITANIAAGTAVVGAWRIGSTLFFRQGIRVEATNSDANDFQYNRVALRAEERIAPAWWRPKAFAKCTGLDAPA